MIDIGEDLIGAYLKNVGACDIVEFNVRTGVRQAEIDVIGLTIVENRVTHIRFCEVATHTKGLGGYQGDVPGKLSKKVASIVAYAGAKYPGVPHTIEIWSPKVAPGRLSKVESALGAGVELVVNETYAERVRELVAVAKTKSAYSDSPSFRMLQILGCLPSSPLA